MSEFSSFARIVTIVTPKQYTCTGLLFGGQRARRYIIWIHGLQSSAFSKLGIVDKLVDKKTAVLTFNNRGFGGVNRLSRGRRSEYIGGTHEKFTDCVDDVQGAINFARKHGAKEIYLAGHSTGCQKIVYWAHKKRGKGVKGLFLLAPISDYAAGVKRHGKKKMEKVVTLARRMVKAGRGSELISEKVWPEELDDAQRFLSLYTPDSIEQSVFPYFDKKRTAKIYGSVKLSICAIFAEKDEYSDRKASDLAKWFKERSGSRRLGSVIVPRVMHGFKGGEVQVARAMRSWIKARR